uniref:FecR family protein n=1 Tax=Burkholderia sp. Ac-20379 TaxID=2703900 RepID=UPI001981C7CF
AARGRRTRRTAASLAVAIALALPAWALLRAYPPGYLLADLHTATGQWQTHVLPDGSRITLDTSSAVNLHYDAHRRTIELVQGAILVDVAKDPERPFVVETRDGSVRALGTRFVVDREADDTVLSMIQSKVAVQTAHERDQHSTHRVQVVANQRVRITADAVSPIETIDARSLSDAWAHRQMVVTDRPLAEVLDTLSRYRRGRIVYDRAAIAAMQVSAVLPLDDTDQALRLLKTTFPALRIRMLTPWITRIDTDPEPPPAPHS